MVWELSQRLWTWYHNKNCHMPAIVVVNSLTLTHYQHTDRVIVRRRCLIPAYKQVTNFCYIFGRGNRSRLIREYIRYCYYCVIQQMCSWCESELLKWCSWVPALLNEAGSIPPIHKPACPSVQKLKKDYCSETDVTCNEYVLWWILQFSNLWP